MVLNLDRIAVDPHFRSYWIQRNITWTRQFRAAASDLYIESARFREERVLLPKSPETEIAAISLAPLAALAPPSTGVYRVVATHDPTVAVTAIQEKLLGSYTAPPPDPGYAPDPSLETPQSASASDLETRIDTLPPVSPSASTDGLAQVIQTSGLDAVLTLSSAQTPVEQDGLWVPIHSAVVLHASSPANPQALASALQQTLRGSLTTATIGINFQTTDESIYALTGPRPLFFALSSTPAQGNLILSSPRRSVAARGTPAQCNRQFAGQNTNPRHADCRLQSLQPTRSLPPSYLAHRRHQQPGAPIHAQPPHNPSRPEWSALSQLPPSSPLIYHQRSLSDAVARLQSERVVERNVDSNHRQTVTYVWASQ